MNPLSIFGNFEQSTAVEQAVAKRQPMNEACEIVKAALKKIAGVYESDAIVGDSVHKWWRSGVETNPAFERNPPEAYSGGY